MLFDGFGQMAEDSPGIVFRKQEMTRRVNGNRKWHTFEASDWALTVLLRSGADRRPCLQGAERPKGKAASAASRVRARWWR